MTDNDTLIEINKLRTMALPELIERYTDAFGHEPRVKQPGYLWKRVAHKLQERRLGGLSKVAKVKLEELIAEITLPDDTRTTAGTLRTTPAAKTLSPGTVLTRKWHGRELRVQVLEHGFSFEGALYKSLTAIARTITGAHMSGPFFFGLSNRKAAS